MMEHFDRREMDRLRYMRWLYQQGDLTEFPDGQRVLFTVTDRGDGGIDLVPVATAIPALEPASVLGYCRACGDELTTRADLCGRCAGLTAGIPLDEATLAQIPPITQAEVDAALRDKPSQPLKDVWAAPQRCCALCAGVIGPDVAGDICPRCSAQMGGGDPGDETRG